MIADVGRTVCNLMAPNGEIYAFFNSVIETKSNAEFYGAYEAASKYKIVFSETEKFSTSPTFILPHLLKISRGDRKKKAAFPCEVILSPFCAFSYFS